MTPSLRIVLLAAMLMGATAQLFDLAGSDGDTSEFPEAVALEDADPQSSVAEALTLAQLQCDTLALLEGATSVEIPLTSDETITADLVLFDTKDGSHFDDALARLSWQGVVSSPAQGADEVAPRDVGMTWSDPCETETFVLTVTSYKTDGSTVVEKSIPCSAGEFDLCLVTVTVETFYEDDDVLLDDDSTSSISVDPVVRRRLRSTLNRNIPLPRNLQETESGSVDVMYLYTDAALTLMGDINPPQMVSIIYNGLVSTNAAFVNSGIDLTFNLAYVGFAPNPEDSTSATGTVMAMRDDEDIEDLRNTYQADLVQLVGSFETSCSAAYNFNGNARNGFSAVNPICIENLSQSHAFGHNLGCYRNREDSVVDSEYEHGYRVCEGDDPFSTIMSIKCPAMRAPRINHFSNPLVNYREQPTGTETEDCARAIRTNMGPVGGFQPVETPPPATAPPTTAPPTTAPPTTVPPTTAPPTTEPPTIVESPAYVTLGCWTDDVADRVLSGASIKKQPDMTTEKCAAYCAGPATSYFGTQYGNECYCGLTTDDPEEYGPSTGCTFPCSGDDSQTCGGNRAINIYAYSEYSYVDCFVDGRDRVLSGEKLVDPAMTADLCSTFCVGAPWFGTEYAVECFCGVEGDNPEVISDGCDFACGGDDDEICGGRDAISIYKPNVVSGGGLGCYADTAADRVFEKALSSTDMTTALCAETCDGSKYYATQFSSECWCGDDDEYARHGESDGCTMACSGAPGEICGGSFAMNVYES
ncbi:unnamed protein product [Sphacelaria rigidula]